MFKLTRTLMVGATLAAISLLGATTIAHAQATDEPSRHDARRPPTQGQVSEAWHKHPVTSQHKTAQERAADAALGRVLARERFSIPNATPADAPAPAPPKESGQRVRLVAWLGGLVAALALAGGLGVLAARRTRRRARLEHAA